MKKLFIFIVLLFAIPFVGVAQNLVGDWSGELAVNSRVALRIVLHIGEDGAVTLDSPDQNAYGIKCKTKFLSADSLNISVLDLGLKYAGQLNDSEIRGTFRQGTAKLPLTLKPGVKKLNRPQTPTPPFSYITEEVVVGHDDVRLAGTLTVPEGANRKTPVVVLVTGSGLQNRDEEIFEHKPFAVIADYFANRGIATLRYDDRGYGQSTGSVDSATTADYALDAQAVVDYLKGTKRFGKVGLLGHSEGGMIAYMLGAKKGGPDFIVAVAGPAVKGTRTSAYQNAFIAKQNGINEADADDFGGAIERVFEYKLANGAVADPSDELIAELYPQHDKNEQTRALAQSLRPILADSSRNAWIEYYFAYDPAADLQKLRVPSFLIYGQKDMQVPAALNAPVARKLAPKALVKEYSELNHMMQHAQTGAVEEYKTIEETFAPEVLADIAQFIQRICSAKD